MVITTLLAGIVVGLAPQDQPVQTKVVQEKKLDLQLDVPRPWNVRRTSYGQELRFKVDGQDVNVRLIVAPLPPSQGLYQESVRDVQASQGNMVVRQWEEEILGVPLLLTQLTVPDKTDATKPATTRLMGLLYGGQKDAFSFQLETLEAAYPAAEQQWRNALLTIRTISGSLPTQAGQAPPDDPEPVRPQNEVKVHVVRPDDGAPKEPKFGPVRVVADESAGLFAYLPEGWSASEEGVLKGPNTTTTITLSVGAGTKEVTRRTYFSKAGSLLSTLTKVEKRHEPKPSVNNAGFETEWMERFGPTADGQGGHRVAFGWSGTLYWTITAQGSQQALEADRRALASLISVLGVRTQ